MISSYCFEKDWFQRLRKKFRKANPVFLEKMIYAFELLSLLQKANLDFVFKGGTSLILLLQNPERLSVDIDIIGNIEVDKLKLLIKNSRFYKNEKDERNNNKWIRHYKFFYHSSFDEQREPNVLLDIVLKKSVYNSILQKSIKTDFFDTDEDLFVKVPTVNSILADKLTAFAPNTIGIRYDKKSNAIKTNIIKQLFDVSILFDFADNINEINQSYRNIHRQECKLNNEIISVEDSLEDTIQTSFLISQSGFKTSIISPETEALKFGCSNLRNYLLNKSFSFNLAKTPAAKAAFLAKSILANMEFDLQKIKYNSQKISFIRNINLSGKYKILNRIKAINPEAFYYWFLFDRIERKENLAEFTTIAEEEN